MAASMLDRGTSNSTGNGEYNLPGAYQNERPDSEPALTQQCLWFELTGSTVLQSVFHTADNLKKRRSQLPGAWEELSETTNVVVDDKNLNELRQTVAALRKEAEKLEAADVLVKKGIEAVARKRMLAEHKRRKQSEWDWCEEAESTEDSSSDDDDDESRRRQSHKLEDDDWEWIEWSHRYFLSNSHSPHSLTHSLSVHNIN